MIYLYAIVDGLVAVADIRGIGGEPLTLATYDGIDVVAGIIEASPTATREGLAAQDEVVRALHQRAAALLPMRFASAFDSHDSAARAVALHADGLHERLARVRHREQMTVRITGLTEAAQSRSGADYLRDRARPRELAPLLEALSPLARATHVERHNNQGLVTVYQLIDRGASDAYQKVVTNAAADIPASSVRVSGPSPCYAFT